MTGIAAYVVDASAGAKKVLPESGATEADALFSAAAAGRVRLFAPEIYISETANILWKRCSLTKDLTPDEAADGLRVLLRTRPVLIPLEPLAEHALQLALKYGRAAYDCFYVSLSLQMRCHLVTADLGLLRQVGTDTGNIVTLDQVALP